MYNLRYHIASLVSVFLALSLGLVLGGLAVGQGAVDRQEGALVEGLQNEFSQLRDENRTLTAENATFEAFTKQTVDAWAVDRLKGRSVIVLSAAGNNDGIVDTRNTVEAAGGTVAVVTMLKPRFGLDDEQVRSQITSAATTDDAETSVVSSLAAEWAGPAPRPMTDLLVDAGVLRVEGLPDKAGVYGLVTIAAREGKVDPLGIALARAFSAPGTFALGAETPASRTGVAAAAADADLSGLDTLGTQIGRYTLISLLSGGEPGYYGTGEGVDGAFPPVAR